jgi:hypothetical protein
MIELACPESCHYLQSAREQAGAREAQLRMREMEAEGKSLSDIDDRLLAINYIIEKAIIDFQREIAGALMPELDDQEVLAAVENSIKNLETEGSGLIYEHRASSPRVQEISRRIRLALDDMAEKLIAEHRPPRSENLRALRFSRDNIESHLRRSAGASGSRNYIRHTAMFFPWIRESSEPLIVSR